MSGVRGGWCVDRGGRLHFIKVATQNAPPIEPPRTVEAARRPLFVSSARRAPGEDMALRSIACRHQDSRESSDEHELAPCRVRARRPPHASGPLGAGRWRGRPDAARREFVLSGRFPAVPMPTNNAPQGPILA